jgi:hypothetical protein
MTRGTSPAIRALLACGIVAPALFVAMTLFVGLRWDSYSVANDTISELSALDAPTRPLWMWLSVPYTALMVAFGWAVWHTRGNRALRMVGALVITQAMIGSFWPPMHQRTVLAADGGTLTDTLHLVWAFMTMVLFFAVLGLGAAAFGTRFRIYSILTIVVLLLCGAMTATFSARVQANLPTPGAGVWERLNVAAYMLWIAVLAMTLLRADWRRRLRRRDEKGLAVMRTLIHRSTWLAVVAGMVLGSNAAAQTRADLADQAPGAAAGNARRGH